MLGKVKWFNEDKGFGYIVPDDGSDEHYFNIKSIKGVDLPKNKDVVEFKSQTNNRGLIATEVILIASSTNNSNDERVVCSGCGKKMIPRFVYERRLFGHGNKLSHSICPYCATEYKDFNDQGSRSILFVIIIAIFLFIVFS